MQSHGGSATLSQLVSATRASSPDALVRILRLLVRRNIFSLNDNNQEEPRYGLTRVSTWLVRGSDGAAPVLLYDNHPLSVTPWHHLSQCVREGGNAFEKAHGRGIFEFASGQPEFNRVFNDGMASATRMMTPAVATEYRNGFESIGSGSTLVDVAGGIGENVREIVRLYPHIKGINFDLPHVVATAPPCDGVTHVGGDMFDSLPAADAIMMKWILHNWSDEDCVRILKNCKKAIPEKTGKLIIVDMVIDPAGNSAFDDAGLVVDLLMMVQTSGRERTESEWKKILNEGGFPAYKVIKISSLSSIIEAYPV
ncbi:Xanthohumol 4-O-methyltransferase [Linum perenne]